MLEAQKGWTTCGLKVLGVGEDADGVRIWGKTPLGTIHKQTVPLCENVPRCLGSLVSD